MILLDTDTCIEILRGNERIIQTFESRNEPAAVCFMTVGELYFGASKSQKANHNLKLVDVLINGLSVIESDVGIMMKFGQIKADLIKTGRPLPDADVLIAATAFMRCSLLVTGNTSHLARIDGLRQENWMRS